MMSSDYDAFTTKFYDIIRRHQIRYNIPHDNVYTTCTYIVYDDDITSYERRTFRVIDGLRDETRQHRVEDSVYIQHHYKIQAVV